MLCKEADYIICSQAEMKNLLTNLFSQNAHKQAFFYFLLRINTEHTVFIRIDKFEFAIYISCIKYYYLEYKFSIVSFVRTVISAKLDL